MAKSKSKSVLSTCNLVSVFCTWCFVHAIANLVCLAAARCATRGARNGTHVFIEYSCTSDRTVCIAAATQSGYHIRHTKRRTNLFSLKSLNGDTRRNHEKKKQHTRNEIVNQKHVLFFIAVHLAGQQRNERNQISQEQKNKMNLIIMNVSNRSLAATLFDCSTGGAECFKYTFINFIITIYCFPKLMFFFCSSSLFLPFHIRHPCATSSTKCNNRIINTWTKYERNLNVMPIDWWRSWPYRWRAINRSVHRRRPTHQRLTATWEVPSHRRQDRAASAAKARMSTTAAAHPRTIRMTMIALKNLCSAINQLENRRKVVATNRREKFYRRIRLRASEAVHRCHWLRRRKQMLSFQRRRQENKQHQLLRHWLRLRPRASPLMPSPKRTNHPQRLLCREPEHQKSQSFKREVDAILFNIK